MRIPNLRLVHGDGSFGLPEAAPFDSIISAAAAAVLPPDLKTQLAPGGRLIAPVGAREQFLLLVERTPAGYVERQLDAVRFVPLRSGKE